RSRSAFAVPFVCRPPTRLNSRTGDMQSTAGAWKPTSPGFAEYCIGDSDEQGTGKRGVPPLCVLRRAPAGMTGWAIASSALYKFAEHFFGINRNKDAAAAGQDFSLLVQDFGFVDVLAALNADFPALHMEWHV